MTESNNGTGAVIVGHRPKVGGGFEYLFSDGSTTPDIRGGSTDDDKGGEGDKDGEGNKGGAITFTSEEEHQASMNKFFNKRFAEINTAAEAKSQSVIDTLKAEIATLKAEGVKGGGNKDADKPDLTAMQAKVDALTEQGRKSLLVSTQAKLVSTALELNAINGEQVAQLISSNIQSDEDGALTVLNPKGDVMYGADGKVMSVKEYLTGFLSENTHLVKPSGGTGAGSQGSNSMKTNDIKKYTDMPAVDRITAYRADHPTTE